MSSFALLVLLLASSFLLVTATDTEPGVNPGVDDKSLPPLDTGSSDSGSGPGPASASAAAAAAAAAAAPAVVVEETNRFVSFANQTTVQVSAITVIGATLIGIAVALAVGGLLPVFSSGAFGGGAGGGFGGLGKRSLADGSSGSSGFSGFLDDEGALKLLTVVDALRGFDVADVDCQRKVVCEVHRQSTSVGGRHIGYVFDKAFDLFNAISPADSDSGSDSGNKALLRKYVEASERGKGHEDCERLYSSCEYSVRKVIRSLGDDDDDGDGDQ